jgi:hypothetical protein
VIFQVRSKRAALSLPAIFASDIHIFSGVNARVSSASAWIDRMVCRHSNYPPNDFHCVSEPSTSSSSKPPTEAGPEPQPTRKWPNSANWPGRCSVSDWLGLILVLSLGVWACIRLVNCASCLGAKSRRHWQGHFYRPGTSTTVSGEESPLSSSFSSENDSYDSIHGLEVTEAPDEMMQTM